MRLIDNLVRACLVLRGTVARCKDRLRKGRKNLTKTKTSTVRKNTEPKTTGKNMFAPRPNGFKLKCASKVIRSRRVEQNEEKEELIFLRTLIGSQISNRRKAKKDVVIFSQTKYIP